MICIFHYILICIPHNVNLYYGGVNNMNKLVTAHGYSNHAESLVQIKEGAIININDRNEIFITYANNFEQFYSINKTLRCTNFLTNYILFDLASSKRVINQNFVQRAMFMMEVKCSYLPPYSHHGSKNFDVEYQDYLKFDDPYAYLLESKNFSFTIDLSANNSMDLFETDSFNITTSVEDSLVVNMELINGLITVNIKSEKKLSHSHIFMITKSFSYFFKFIRGISNQISYITISDLRLPFNEEETEGKLYCDFNFENHNGIHEYLYSSPFKCIPTSQLINALKLWHDIYFSNIEFFESYFSSSQSEYAIDRFLNSCKRIEYLFSVFLKQTDTERVHKLEKELIIFYKEASFSSYITDTSYRKEYSRNAPKIHQKVIDNIIHHATYDRVSFESKLTKLRITNHYKILEQNTLVQSIITSTQCKDIESLISHTRNKFTHFIFDDSKTIPEADLYIFKKYLDDIFVHKIAELLCLDSYKTD